MLISGFSAFVKLKKHLFCLKMGACFSKCKKNSDKKSLANKRNTNNDKEGLCHIVINDQFFLLTHVNT